MNNLVDCVYFDFLLEKDISEIFERITASGLVERVALTLT